MEKFTAIIIGKKLVCEKLTKSQNLVSYIPMVQKPQPDFLVRGLECDLISNTDVDVGGVTYNKCVFQCSCGGDICSAFFTFSWNDEPSVTVQICEIIIT